MKSLDHTHAWPIGPIETAWRGMPEMDFLIAELDRLQARIDHDLDPCGHGRGKAQIICRRHAIDDHACVVAPGDGAIVGNRGPPPRETVQTRPVVKPAINAVEVAALGESLQRLIGRGATAEIGKIGGRPDILGCFENPLKDSLPQILVLGAIDRVRNMPHISDAQ
jgi:hypothetical protein